MLNKIDKWLYDHHEEIVDELCDWIRIRSVSDESQAAEGAPFGPECARMLEHALESARAKGFAVENHQGYCGSVYLGEQSREIGIAAHLDVVPEGNDWINEPYKGEVIGRNRESSGWVVGRGASDNKGMAVMGLYALMCARDLELPLKHRLRLMLGTSEETGMGDMKYMARKAEDPASGITLPDLTLVPDSDFPVCTCQKGRMLVEIVLQCGDDLLALEGGSVPNAVADRAAAVLPELSDLETDALRSTLDVEPIAEGILLRAHGKAAHAASPAGSVNAIGVLANALLEHVSLTAATRRALRAVSALLADDYGAGANIAYEDEQSGRLTFTCGMARFKAGRITLTMDCRFPATTDVNDMRAKLCVRLTNLGAAIKRIDLGNTFYIEDTDPRVDALTSAYREVTGDTAARNYSMGGGTYSKVLPNAITFGGNMGGYSAAAFLPEGHGGAHSPDEVMSVDALLKCIKTYVYAITKLDAIV